MRVARFNTPGKVRDMLKILLSEDAEVGTEGVGDHEDIIVSYEGVMMDISFVCGAMSLIRFTLRGRKRPFGTVDADAVEFKVMADGTIDMRTISEKGGIDVILPGRSDLKKSSLKEEERNGEKRQKTMGETGLLQI